MESSRGLVPGLGATGEGRRPLRQRVPEHHVHRVRPDLGSFFRVDSRFFSCYNRLEPSLIAVTLEVTEAEPVLAMNPYRIGYPAFTIIGIKLEKGASPDKVASTLLAMLGISSAVMVTGRFSSSRMSNPTLPKSGNLLSPADC